MNIEHEARELLTHDFDLEKRNGETFIETLANKVAYLLEHNPDLLFSYFYRMDIAEEKIERIITEPGPIAVNIALANLILERQIRRAQTKKAYKQNKDIEF